MNTYKLITKHSSVIFVTDECSLQSIIDLLMCTNDTIEIYQIDGKEGFKLIRKIEN